MMDRRPIRPAYDAFRSELNQCRRLGVAAIGPNGRIIGGYTANDPVSSLVLMADDMRLDGHVRAAGMLNAAAEAVARAQAVAVVAARRGHVRMTPKRLTGCG
jgi:hypothetical protein